MKCEKCGKEHDGSFGSGRFCNRACANSRGPRSYETRKKISESLSSKGYKKDKEEVKNETKEYGKPSYCKNCGRKFKKKGKKYCGPKCQRDFAHKQYIKKWKNNEVDGSKSGGVTISNHVRRYLWEKYNGTCSRCGWNTPNPITEKPVLEVEHIDGDSTNNREENLDLICPNCHSLTPTYKALNYGNGNRQRLKYYKLI